MPKLVVEIEVQTYGGEDEEKEALEQIRQAIILVTALPEISVGTFVRTEVKS